MIATFIIKMDVDKMAVEENQTPNHVVETYTQFFTEITSDKGNGRTMWLDSVIEE